MSTIRLLDVVLCLIIGIFIIPIIILLSICILLFDDSPIFYKQTRIGKNLREFKLIKFRSMINDPFRDSGSNYSGGNYITTSVNDVRVTKIGKFLRKYSLDEIPQLLCVLKGDMSFVGPRPDVPAQIINYTENEWLYRHKIRPGITGKAQISGRSKLSHKERLKYDLWLVDNINVFIYIKIIFLTFLQIFSQTQNSN